MDDFEKQKSARLNAAVPDLSRKGSVDERVQALVDWINGRPGFFTTSSCSGRIVMFSESEGGACSKKGVHWHLASHDLVDEDEIMTCLERDKEDDLVLKFEPFILHVQCRSLHEAKAMHTLALEAGFRNSGLTLGKKEKVILAVRSTHALESPLTQDGEVLVMPKYVKLLVRKANEKLEETWRRTDKFFQLLKSSDDV